MKSFARVQSSDRLMNQLQDSLGKAIDNLNGVPLNSGLLLSGVSLVIGDNTIYTTLPNALVGWIVTRKSAAAGIYDKQATNTNSATLVLNSDAVVTVSLFVF